MLAVADDYEDLNMILKEVGKQSDRFNLGISIAEILKELAQLIENDLVKTYLLPQPGEIRNAPAQFNYEEQWIYFLLSKKGVLEVQKIPPELFPE
jgi:hypothetical protein